MKTFLILLSFILNFVSILAIIVLYLRQNRLIHFEKNQDKQLKEMEEVISAFLVEIKEDNEAFVNKIQSINQIKSSEYVTKNTVDLSRNSQEEVIPESRQEEKPVEFSIERKEVEIIEEQPKTLLEEILILQQEGYSEDEIAKKLNKGKTEIQLLLKFNQNQ